MDIDKVKTMLQKVTEEASQKVIKAAHLRKSAESYIAQAEQLEREVHACEGQMEILMSVLKEEEGKVPYVDSD